MHTSPGFFCLLHDDIYTGKQEKITGKRQFSIALIDIFCLMLNNKKRIQQEGEQTKRKVALNETQLKNPRKFILLGSTEVF
jgi:hypothetical protein